MRILEKYCKAEYVIKNSKFLSELIPCTSQAEARNIIKEQKTKYFDSTHVVHAFVIGLKGEVMGMSDDGEPSGTAGRPTLDVLKGRNITNCILTITRWFGGTLLGTGGLVKAYSEGAKLVLEEAENTGAAQEYIERKDFNFNTDYTTYQAIKKLMEDFAITDLTETFLSDIELKGRIVATEYNNFATRLKNTSNGKINLS